VKYLLPGEERLFAPHHPDVPLVEKPWYLQVIQETCCCVRSHRMFACRSFPFRPVLDERSGEVVDLIKVNNPVFEPCWIDRPLPDWRSRAIEAWKVVLGDRDNRLLYGRVAFLSRLLDRLGNRFYEVPEGEIDDFLRDALSRASTDELERLCREHFPGATNNR
jgi:hypothetical protein